MEPEVGQPEEDLEECAQGYTLHLNMRIMPYERAAIYEDSLERSLTESEIGWVSGGGTAPSYVGEPLSCDVDIELVDGAGGNEGKLLEMLAVYKFPKGSILYCPDDTRVELGTLEGLALYLNGTDLPAEVYQETDLDSVLSEATRLLSGTGSAYVGCWEGPTGTALYFYGPSYEGIVTSLNPLIETHPLCQKCMLTQIA
jgi:hypothetical protein